MKREERACIFKIVSDLIKSDTVIDMRELEVIDSIRERFSICKQDEIDSARITLAKAVDVINRAQSNVKEVVSEFLKRINGADGYIAREEALLMLSIELCMKNDENLDARIISIDTTDFHEMSNQVLYVESRYDRDINWTINENYRSICSEMSLAGFDFIYIPQIAEHYRALKDEELASIVQFIYPEVSEVKASSVIKQFKRLSTSDFCKCQFSDKHDFNDISMIRPSIMLKIGASIINGKLISDFLLVELNKDVLSTIRNFIDLFFAIYPVQISRYVKHGNGRFIYTGFYKQIFDLYMQNRCVQSSVVVDIYRNEILFPEAGAKLEKLHRREKALYTLFLIESASGGINFTKPTGAKHLEKYNRRMGKLQKKYCLIYHKFGGEMDKAPNIEQSEIRLPMISLIKRQLSKLDDKILNIGDYMISRNFYGNYSINISTDRCLCANVEKNDISIFAESPDWINILAL